MFKINKKGIELSVNFLVMIIISLAVLAMALTFTKNIYTKTQEIRLEVDRQTEERIESLLDDGSRIVIPYTRKEVKRGDLGIFAVGVLNVLGSASTFNVELEFSSAFNKDKEAILPIELTLIAPDPNQKEINNNDNHKFSFGVNVPKTAKSGTYIIDVTVEYDDGGGFKPYGDPAYPVNKVFVSVP